MRIFTTSSAATLTTLLALPLLSSSVSIPHFPELGGVDDIEVSLTQTQLELSQMLKGIEADQQIQDAPVQPPPAQAPIAQAPQALTPPEEAQASPVQASTASTPVAPPAAQTQTRVSRAPKSDYELKCLALNIYHEARSEPESGQIAVAQVTMNRVASKDFPDSICKVITQGGQRLHRCQFSWWCDGKSDLPTELKAWQRSMKVAKDVLARKKADPTGGALFYHAHYVEPRWASVFERTAEIGQHLFYRPAPG